MRKARSLQARRSSIAVRLIRLPVRQRPGETARFIEGSLALAGGPPASPGGAGGPPAPVTRQRLLLGRPPDRDPDLTASARVIIQLLIEVLAGRRAPHQLAWRASAQVRDDFARLRPPGRATRRTAHPTIIRFWVQHPVPDQAEAGAVAFVGERVHAVAVRLERHRGQWRCTAVETTAPPQ